MKTIHLLAIGVLLSACTTDQPVTLSLENTSQETRIDAGITISREEISAWTNVNDTLLPVLVEKGGSTIPSQVDDLNGDGSWDELFIVTDLAGNETKELTLDFVERSSYPKTAVRTNIRFANKKQGYKEVSSAIRETHATNTITQKVWQMEGIAWENDFLGFRNYFDQRNGMDIFGKVTNAMILDSVGSKNSSSYHSYNPDWGVDVLKVGESLGAGSIAYLYNDSLFRVGDNGVGSCDVIVEGPLRSIFQFKFGAWNLDGTIIDVIQDVSIQAGTFYFESEVSYSGIEDKLELVTGIVNKKSKELFEIEDVENHKVFYTHDMQSEDTTLLGMGILVSESLFSQQTETPKTGGGIVETYCVHEKASPGEPVSFRFYAVWERQNEKWADPLAFEELLKMDAEFLNHPVTVRRK